jgi:streptogramin lyase
MNSGFPTKVGVFLGLGLIILFGSIGNNQSLSSAVRGELGEQYVFVTKWGSLGTGNGQFRDAGGIGVDALGHIYVVDRGNDRIEKFDSNGKFITAWGSPGSANGQFNYPEGITVDALGNVYVVDHGNDRIEKFDSNGKFITAWGSLGTSNGQFNRISDVAVGSAGQVYVSDYGNDNVQVFGLS